MPGPGVGLGAGFWCLGSGLRPGDGAELDRSRFGLLPGVGDVPGGWFPGYPGAWFWAPIGASFSALLGAVGGRVTKPPPCGSGYSAGSRPVSFLCLRPFQALFYRWWPPSRMNPGNSRSWASVHEYGHVFCRFTPTIPGTRRSSPAVRGAWVVAG